VRLREAMRPPVTGAVVQAVWPLKALLPRTLD